jgi:hypothetical protein
MSVHTDFYIDINFGGDVDSFSLNNDWRYWWVVFGSKFGNNISSFRSTAYGGTDGNTFAFTGNNFLGTYLSLNMQEGWTSWWSYVGDDLNDKIESAILVNRNKNEFVTGLKDQIAGDFASGMDAQLKGTQVSRRGAPRIYTTFWPGYDPQKTFVSIEQDLHVSLDWWPDYDAQVRYDIYLYLDGNGVVQGYVARSMSGSKGVYFPEISSIRCSLSWSTVRPHLRHNCRRSWPSFPGSGSPRCISCLGLRRLLHSAISATQKATQPWFSGPTRFEPYSNAELNGSDPFVPNIREAAASSQPPISKLEGRESEE